MITFVHDWDWALKAAAVIVEPMIAPAAHSFLLF